MGTGTKLALAAVLGLGAVGVAGVCVASGGIIPGLATTFNLAASGTSSAFSIGGSALSTLGEGCSFVAPYIMDAGNAVTAAMPAF